jgi:hypothetical protein
MSGWITLMQGRGSFYKVFYRDYDINIDLFDDRK